MKNLIHLLSVCFAIVFLSCENQHTPAINYKQYISQNEKYEIDIPTDFMEKYSEGDKMAFHNENAHAFIDVRPLGSNESLWSFSRESQRGLEDNNFSHSLFEQSDSTCFYKVTRGANAWTAYELYMSKQIEGKKFVVKVSSDVLSKDYMLTLVKHIQASLKSHNSDTIVAENHPQKRKNTVVAANNEPEPFKTRQTKYYSIKYPQDWKMLTNYNEFIDVYIGSPDGQIGFTVLFVETDESLYNVVKEGNIELEKAGFNRIISNNKTTVNGQECYKTLIDVSMDNTHWKHVSYTFKKGNMIYNVKFGGLFDVIGANTNLINQIISTFQMK